MLKSVNAVEKNKVGDEKCLGGRNCNFKKSAQGRSHWEGDIEEDEEVKHTGIWKKNILSNHCFLTAPNLVW